MDSHDVLIVHNKCGLPVELCDCPDAEVRYDYDNDKFEIISKPPFNT